MTSKRYDFVFFTDVTDTVLIYKSIGAYKCANILRNAGYTVLVVDHLHTFTREEFDFLLEKIVSTATKFVGFSTTFVRTTYPVVPSKPTRIEPILSLDNFFFPQQQEFEIASINKIKELNPECKIVVGGAYASPLISNPRVDYAVIGFAEVSALSLANHLAKQMPLKSYVNKNNITIIDDKAAEGFDFHNSTFAWAKTDNINCKVLPLEVSRGCIFKCKFCSFPLIGKKNNDYIRTAANIRDELQRNYDIFGVETYYIIDETFNDNAVKLNEIQKAVQSLSFRPKFWAYTRLDLLMAKDQISQLYDIGLRGMYFGIETLNPLTGRTIGKGWQKEKLIKQVQDISAKYGNEISMHGSFIIGLPYESIASSTDTFNKLISNELPLHTYRFAGLGLFRENALAWSSELVRNYSTYGYTVLDKEYDSNQGMSWKNEYTNRDEAIALAAQWNAIAQESPNYYVPNQVTWALANYGLSINELNNTKYADLKWADLERNKKVQFIAEYKEALMRLI